MKIIPTIFARNKKEFKKRFKTLLQISDDLQIDFMDGKFVPEKSVLLYQIPNLKGYNKNFEAHLMINNPIRDIKILKEKGFKKVIFHYEALKTKKRIFSLMKLIKKHNLISFIAINPETLVDEIVPYLKELDGVLFMGVNPGKEHQDFIPKVYTKISNLRALNKKIKIQIDGGVNESVAKKLVAVGVDFINSGSFVSEAENPKQALEKLKEVFKKI